MGLYLAAMSSLKGRDRVNYDRGCWSFFVAAGTGRTAGVVEVERPQPQARTNDLEDVGGSI
jgi:hypothetical protein